MSRFAAVDSPPPPPPGERVALCRQGCRGTAYGLKTPYTHDGSVGHSEGIKGLSRHILSRYAPCGIPRPLDPFSIPKPNSQQPSIRKAQGQGQGPARKPQRKRAQRVRTGEDWGEAEPLTLNRSGRRSSGGVRGFRPKAVPCTPATWRTRGVGQRPTVFRLGPVLAVEAGRRAGRTGRDHRHGSRTHPAGQAACLEAIPRARLWRGWQRRPESCAGCPVSVWPWTLLPACEPRSVASWPSPV